ncbi:hypothetical protein [Mycobacteroides abscessus]|uniref:hypothetical protein n=1 Tax=Mycobacteroides abscessus TaxID=36809 RepID=UPI00266DA58B|nr:hypothetical protein [Mycobacteroides abscessus]MDO3331489.1 hypothetical protein [Mycobacteroides abscessus subsp. abscessus]
MGRVHQVVLRRSRVGEFVARVDPEDYGYSSDFGAGSAFDTAAMPSVLVAAVDYFGDVLEAVWVDDISGDGWDCDHSGFDRYVPWDGPVSLYDEPDLPYLVPVDGGEYSRSCKWRQVRSIHLEGKWRNGPWLYDQRITRSD